MKIDVKDTYSLITVDEKSVNNFYDSLIEKEDTINNNHVIIVFSENFNISSKEIVLFLGIANNFRELGMSFVLVCSEIDIDNVPDEIVVVPTLHEAEDVLEMEAIERDLMNF